MVDVLVIGGGPGGTPLAMALARAWGEPAFSRTASPSFAIAAREALAVWNRDSHLS